MSNLYDASQQWATRPDDERFWTLEEMMTRCAGHAASAREAHVNMADLRVETDRNDLALVGQEGLPARFTHWSFGQLCSRVGAPASYLRTLDADTAATCLSYGLKKVDGEANVLMHSNGSLQCRSFTSEQYSRIWNWEIIRRLQNGAAAGWRVPPARAARPGQAGARPATAADILRTSINIREGVLIAPSGLYASDHDMFAFMVNEDYRIEDGTEGGLSRGFFVTNSEVGAAAFKITKFLYRHVCGNHIVWDAKDVQELRIVHRGRADQRFGHQLQVELRKYANESTEGDVQRIEAAKRFEIAATKDEVLDALFGKRIAPRKTLEAAYDKAVVEYDMYRVSPRTAWGMAQGLTRLSQKTQYADERVDLDRAAGKVLSMAF